MGFIGIGNVYDIAALLNTHTISYITNFEFLNKLIGKKQKRWKSDLLFMTTLMLSKYSTKGLYINSSKPYYDLKEVRGLKWKKSFTYRLS